MRQRGKASFMTEGLVASTYPAPGEGRRGVGVLQGEPLSPLRPEESPFVRCVGGRGRLTHVPASPTRDPAEALARSLAASRGNESLLSLSLSQSVLTGHSAEATPRDSVEAISCLFRPHSERVFRRPRHARGM